MNAKEIAKKYNEEIWNQKDLSAIDRYLDPHILIHSLLGKFYGQDAMREIIAKWQSAFPDLVVNTQTLIGEEDTVIIHWEAHGTQTGEFKDIAPTGRKVAYSGVTIYRVLNDRIVEYWAYLDMQHLMKQLALKQTQ